MEWTTTIDAPGKVCLMQGNEAIVRGAVEAGINFAASYPGSPSSQILDMLGRIANDRGFYAQWATNEVCALEACIGTSLAHARSMCIVKQNGFLCCADALHCGAQHGVIGGVVVVTSDDPSAHSSTNEFDSRFMAESADLPMLEPTNMQEAKDLVPYAFELSERLRQIVVIRLTTRVCHGRGNVVLGELPEKANPLQQVNEWDRLVCVCYRHTPMLQTLEKFREEFEKSPYNHYEGPAQPEKLVVAGGTGCLYAKEALRRLGLADEIGLLSLATVWPMPEELLLSHMRRAKSVLVAEEVDPFLEKGLQALAGKHQLQIRFAGRGDGALPRIGELNPDVVLDAVRALAGIREQVQVTGKKGNLKGDKTAGETAPLLDRELNFCAGCPHRATFYLLRRALKRCAKEPGVVIGDIGCYIMSSQEAGHYIYQACNCMGSGINLAEGLGQLHRFGMHQPVVTMCGDSTFFHAALPGLVNASYYHSNMLMMVLDNSATAMTGFQPHPGTGITAIGGHVEPMSIRAICESMGCKVTEADPFDVKGTQKLLEELIPQPGLKVLIMRQPCATLMSKKQREKRRVRVDQDKCIGDGCGCDRYCSRVWGCPGNSWDYEKNKAVIDPVSCVGCGVCAELCPAGAIIVEGGEE